MFVSVDLPIPGEPPSSTSEPGTSPPPSTRSSSPIPSTCAARARADLAQRARHSAGPRARPPAPGEPPPRARRARLRAPGRRSGGAPRRACSTPRIRGTGRATGPTESRTASSCGSCREPSNQPTRRWGRRCRRSVPPDGGLRRSYSSTSRQRPSDICPIRRLTPTSSKPQRSCSAIEAMFSGKIPASSVQNPRAQSGDQRIQQLAPTPRRAHAGST